MDYPMQLYTDQANCYNEHGEEISCTGSGQDGETRFAPEVTRSRFKIEGDIVADTRTGLHWCRNAGLATFPLSWTEAFEYIEALNASQYGERADWHLPSRKELYSLVSHRYINPALPEANPFTEVFSGYYWTSSPCSRLVDQAWYIHLGGGRIYRGIKKNAYMVWPAAGEQPRSDRLPTRFITGGNTLLDRLTRREWRIPEGIPGQPATWKSALETIDAMNRHQDAGFERWRLPNIRELDSLVDLNRHSPALPEAFRTSQVAEGYWSSTTSAYEKRYAWVLYPRDGAIGVGFKAQADFSILAVRNEL